MSGHGKDELSTTQAALAQLQRELRGTQEMLAHVLLAINEPVRVTFEQMQEGIPEGRGIEVLEDVMGNQFIFSLVDNEQ